MADPNSPQTVGPPTLGVSAGGSSVEVPLNPSNPAEPIQVNTFLTGWLNQQKSSTLWNGITNLADKAINGTIGILQAVFAREGQNKLFSLQTKLNEWLYKFGLDKNEKDADVTKHAIDADLKKAQIASSEKRYQADKAADVAIKKAEINADAHIAALGLQMYPMGTPVKSKYT